MTLSDRKQGNPAMVLVGCGAIAESFYLPALRNLKNEGFSVYLADKHMSRASQMAYQFGFGEPVEDLSSISGEVLGAIVATPPQSHYEVAMEFLKKGVHVLCEKPLVETVEQFSSVLAACKDSKATLCVNNTRRLFPNFQRVKEILDEGSIGEVVAFSAEEGGEYSWPTVSGFYFQGTASDKGVLFDRGAHLLDLFCWWFGRRPEVVEFLDDSFGGCEAVAQARLSFSQSFCGSVRLSWFNRLANEIRIEGKDGIIICKPHDWRHLRILKGRKGIDCPVKSEVRYFSDFGQIITENFIRVIQGRAKALIPAESVFDSIAVMEDCYRMRKRFSMPWM